MNPIHRISNFLIMVRYHNKIMRVAAENAPLLHTSAQLLPVPQSNSSSDLEGDRTSCSMS